MADTKPGTEPFDIPGEANAEQGHVVLDGPDGVAITMTPAAAEGTAQNLIEAARKAREAAA